MIAYYFKDRIIRAESLDNYGVESHQCPFKIRLQLACQSTRHCKLRKTLMNSVWSGLCQGAVSIINFPQIYNRLGFWGRINDDKTWQPTDDRQGEYMYIEQSACGRLEGRVLQSIFWGWCLFCPAMSVLFCGTNIWCSLYFKYTFSICTQPNLFAWNSYSWNGN